MNEIWSVWILPLGAATVRASTPLIFAAMGGLLSERSGVINIALEGMMLIGAFAGAVATLSTSNPWLGALVAGGAGLSIAAFYAFFTIQLKSNQIVAGTALNLLAAGIPPFLAKLLYGVTGSTPSIPIASRFQFAPIAIVWLIVFGVRFWMRSMASGLWVSFAGENPHALDAAGIRVNRVRWMAVLASGFLAGLGGASLSVFLSSSYSRNMVAGRGFMALAALIFGKWRPVPTALACLFFGLTDALQVRLQGASGTEGFHIPAQLIQIIPYVVTIAVLAGFVGHSRAPKAIGISYSLD